MHYARLMHAALLLWTFAAPVSRAAPDTAPATIDAPAPSAPSALSAPAVPSAPAAALAAAAAKIPVDAFSATPFLDDPVLSPRGDRVAARMNLKGREVFGIIFLKEKGRKPELASTGEHDLRWYRWAGEDRLIMSIGIERRLGDYDVYLSRLVSYDVNTAKLQYLGRKRAGLDGDDVIFVDPDGSYLLLSVAKDFSSYPAVYRIDLVTGEPVQILSDYPPILAWYADSKGVVRLGVGWHHSKLKFIYRENEADKFRTIAKMSLEELDGDFEGARFRGQSGKGYVVSNARTGRFALYEFDWKTFEFGKPVFEHPRVDLDAFELSEDGEEVTAVYYTDDRERVEWLDPKMKTVQATLDKTLPERLNRVIGWSTDRMKMMVWSGAANDPGAYYVYDRAARTLELLATPYEKLEDTRLAPMQAVTYKARDGLEIPAYLTLPVGRPATNLPLVIMPHGGPHVRDTWGYNPWVQFLANRGYAVLQPNFRGSSGYGTAYLEKGFGQWGAGMQDDLTDGVRWLSGEGIADPRRVCIMGASYGGYAALMGAIKTPDLFRCAISFAGVTDVNDMMRFDRNQMLPSRYKRWRERVRGKEEVDLRSVSPVNKATDVAVPVLLMHGTGDDNVPYRQAERFAKAMRKVGKPFDFVEFEDAGHSLSTETERARFLTAVEKFLATHNPAD